MNKLRFEMRIAPVLRRIRKQSIRPCKRPNLTNRRCRSCKVPAIAAVKWAFLPLGRRQSQSWWFVPLEVRVVSAEEKALQPLGIPQDLLRNALPLHFKKIGEPVNGADDFSVNQRVGPGQLGIPPCGFHKCLEALKRVPTLV